jgi:hypothetical protein
MRTHCETTHSTHRHETAVKSYICEITAEPITMRNQCEPPAVKVVRLRAVKYYRSRILSSVDLPDPWGWCTPGWFKM